MGEVSGSILLPDLFMTFGLKDQTEQLALSRAGPRVRGVHPGDEIALGVRLGGSIEFLEHPRTSFRGVRFEREDPHTTERVFDCQQVRARNSLACVG
jgi:hypothetical protein